MADTAIIRCPVCLTSQIFPANTPAHKTINCGNCDRNFAFGQALRAPSEAGQLPSAVSVSDTSAVSTHFTVEEDRRPEPVRLWLTALPVCFLLVLFVRGWVRDMRGPEFLGSYFLVFLVILFAVVFLRKRFDGSSQISWLGFLSYESIGLLRYIDATAMGMSKFDFMFIMMGVGGVLLFLRADSFGDGDGWWSSSCSSGCSSSSSCSGCGGGGGCGGCGG